MNDAGHGPIGRKVAKVSSDDVSGAGGDCAFEDAVVVGVCGERKRYNGFNFPDGWLETGDQQIHSWLDRFELGAPEHIHVFSPQSGAHSHGETPGKAQFEHLFFEATGLPARGN